ncbi:hypothetical protein PILCRDRAFT_2789 [Piloderma croceum F 1598]|uniref:DNA replication regulator SLD2 n=1 Tax=Piloderma croceum (strain F 1598) TaxID=765440 RepID=A0A0C3FVN9_PILCF|nr:hypothetical protein PILCRDRAFT_2789 [Piloderma croceum F 1598]
MLHVASVRSEIKTWERNFKDNHGREPSVQDIKAQPAIAEKYKLYKKLSKAAATAAETQPGPSPSTPQKRDSRPSLLLSKPRVVEPTAPLALYNPFSPVKNKGKQKDNSARPTPEDLRRFSVFASPSKRKNDPKLLDAREPSPDALPEILPFHPIASSSAQRHLPAEDAVSRARKRLRGEPVSPSPNKQKRRRVGSSQNSLPFAILGTSDPDSNDDDDDMDDAGEADSSFVDDSPVKAPAGGKSFKLLFEESLPKNGASKRKGSLTRSKTTPASAGLFGDRATDVGKLIKEDTDQDLGPIVQEGVNPAKGDHLKNGIVGILAMSTIGWLPGKDNLFSEKVAPPFDNTQMPATKRHSSLGSESRKAAKRSLSDAEDDVESDCRKSQSQHVAAPKLLPPSPPAESSSRGSTSNFKGKGKATGSRKKAKVQEEVEEEDESIDEGKVRRIRRVDHKPSADRPDFDFDSDWVLGTQSHRGSRDPLPVSQGQEDSASPNQSDSKSGREVDLPDKLRRVLAISTSSKSLELNEERVVRGLLSGKRATHYDPSKGGEIWDVGEEDQIRIDTEGEDDWEGEGVPWEVGEL